jgi:hypothetical protein
MEIATQLPLSDAERGEMLAAAERRPEAHKLLAHLVIGSGLPLEYALELSVADVTEDAGGVEVQTPSGSLTLAAEPARLAQQLVRDAAPDTPLLHGRAGNGIDPIAARGALLSLAQRAGVPAARLAA